MARFRLAPAAENDIAEILRWTDQEFGEQASIEIARVLHDSMDLARHLPDDYPSEPGE